MDTSALATIVSAVLSAIIGYLSWRLSARVQQTAIDRQTTIDRGQFVEESRTFERDIRDWLRKELEVRDRECEQDKMRIRHNAVARERYWRGRALGHITADDSPPPEIYGEIG